MSASRLARSLEVARTYASPITVFVMALILWEILVPVLNMPEFIVPRPSSIVRAALDPGSRWPLHASVTVYEVAAGFFAAVAGGYGLALLLVSSPALRRVVMPYVVILQIVPKLAIAPLLVVWFGLSDVPKITIAFLIAFFPILIDSMAGLENVDPDLLDLAHSLNATRAKEFLRIRMPHSLPYLFNALKVAITLAVVGAIVGEFVGSQEGLGYIVQVSQVYANTPQGFASITYLSAIGILTFLGVLVAERLMIPWHKRKLELHATL